MNIKQFIFDNSPVNEHNQKCPIILEAGTAEGYDTRWFGETFPFGKIYGIEPIDPLFNNVSILTHNFKNVKLFNCALSNKNGEDEMFVSYYYGRPTGSSSILEPQDHIHLHPEITFNGKQKVKTITLNTLVQEEKIDKIDFMWLDLQGFEPLVLGASVETLKITNYLYCEVTMIDYYKNNVKYPEFKKFLNDNHFEVIDDSEIFTANGVERAGNVLFKNKLLN